MQVEPQALFPGVVMLVAPHMDDELLACGGTMALLPHKERIHVVYATDGMKSPAPIRPGDAITPDLGQVREGESIAAMERQGVARENLHFLRLPEAALNAHLPALRQGLSDLIGKLRPDAILLPFRYDRHPDHLAINRLLTAMRKADEFAAELVEYFVYYRWRLLPARDVRRYIRSEFLLEVDTRAVAELKRAALDCFVSQTTRYYPWQTRPILTPVLLDETVRTPELFVRTSAAPAGAAIFARAVIWIRLVHVVEPYLQRWKYLVGARLRRRLRGAG